MRRAPAGRMARRTRRHACGSPCGEYHFLYKHGTGASSAVDSYASGSSVKPGYSYTSCTYVVERDPYGLDLPTLPDLLKPTSALR